MLCSHKCYAPNALIVSNLGHGGGVKTRVRYVYIIHPNQFGLHHHEHKLQLNDTLKHVFEPIDPPTYCKLDMRPYTELIKSILGK